jgi:hypothetical protein
MFSFENPRKVTYLSPGGGTFQQYANRQVAYKGNAPGFPHEFRYLDGADGRVHSNREYIDIRPEGAFDIHQAAQEQPIYGEYAGGQVPDLPFDQKGWKDKENLYAVVGLGALLVGVILYFRRGGLASPS